MPIKQIPPLKGLGLFLVALMMVVPGAPEDFPHLTEVVVYSNEVLNRFVPSHALGAALDGHEKGELAQMLSERNVSEMLTAGLKPLSYRLRTELAGEAWHWNNEGVWSERKGQGYWMSSAKPGKRKLDVSYGFRLPRRGNTFDQANDDDYSRLDDGDTSTFWKSNPYLDQRFTRRPNSTLPQWVLIDLGKKKAINAIRLLWAEPFATSFEVQFGDFANVDDISQALPTQWQVFSHGTIHSQTGGDTMLRLSEETVVTRFVRLVMKESSEQASRSKDVRDRLGYALREIYLGVIDDAGSFRDELHHGPDNETQTPIYVSSTDPWHRRSDKDPLIEQIGFDRLFKSRLTNSLPVLMPVSVLYDTPENAGAELRYLKTRQYPIDRIELGEEPDGQFVTPEDYAALYIQFARALHAVDPDIKLGGPSFQDIAEGKDDWLRRFLAYLGDQHELKEFTFASFEWYPFDNVCEPSGPHVQEATKLLAHLLGSMRATAKSSRIPWIMTEYGYSAFGGRAEMDIEGALFNADVVGNFLALGGEETFLYGYEPNEILDEVDCSRGNNMLFLLGNDGNIAYRMPTYYAASLLTHEWVIPGDGLHELDRASSDDPLVTAYSVRRPDNTWSLLLINKDSENARKLKVTFNGQGGFLGEVSLVQYSRKQYELGADYRPIRDLPPEHQLVNFGPDTTLTLPPYSISVVAGGVTGFNR